MPVTARIAASVDEIAAADWDACAGTGNPFTRHAFFQCLEQSGSAVAATGWAPAHVVLDGADGRPDAIAPAYVKSHSQGEYVFDHGWAEAFERAGGRYYPKLQLAVPFSPVTGDRLLLRQPATAASLIAAVETLLDRAGLSSAHATFIRPDQVPAFEAADWLIRIGEQFHWSNPGYRDFGDFLDALSSRKRKTLRKERDAALSGGIEIEQLTGASLTEAHWDAFWTFYQDTGARKWGRPYLTRDFFSLLSERMGDQVLLMLAKRGGRYIAGALNLVGDNTLYGRYWGCTEDVPFLHFELCYHQAVEWAITHGKSTVEAGAQGAHKLARGYLPVPTYSAHRIAHPGLRAAVERFVAVEREAVSEEIDALAEHSPFRRG